MSKAWCIVDDAPILGGAELFALRLAKALRARGDAVTIATPGEGSLAHPAARDGIAVRELRLPRLVARHWAAIPGGVWETRRLLAGLRGTETVVVANTAGAQAYCAAAAASLRGGPAVVHLVHEQMTAARRSARFVLGRSPAVVANGANTLLAYEAALGRQDVGRLNNFVDSDLLGSGAPAPRGATADPPVVGVLARMVAEKGVLEAVDELADAGTGWSRARIAGPNQDEAYRAAVVARVEERGLGDRIELLGLVEVPGFFAGIDVLLVPSTGTEGLPTVILEALAHGRPVVVREPMFSADFAQLPVVSYRDAKGLGAALADLPEVDAAARAEVARRFGPQQAIAALEAAAGRAVRAPG
jgi:glycosyltransferase involved in cell wall biosynthesis